MVKKTWYQRIYYHYRVCEELLRFDIIFMVVNH